MNEDSLRQYASQLGIRCATPVSASGWLQAPCPFAPYTHERSADTSPSFGLRVNEEGPSVYKCFACKSHGSIPNLCFALGRARGVNYHDLGMASQRTELSLADSSLERLSWNAWDTAPVSNETQPPLGTKDYDAVYSSAVGHPYLSARQIGWKATLRLNLRYDSYQKRILFPVYDTRQRLRGFSGRSIIPDSLRPNEFPKVRDYRNLRKRNYLLGEHLIRPEKLRRIIVVEGLFDFARMLSLGIPGVVCLLGSELSPSKRHTLLQWNLPVVWFVDNDEGGRQFLFGPADPETKAYNQKGVLNRLYGEIPQFTVQYPAWAKDPGYTPGAENLTHANVCCMLEEADLYVKY